MTARTNAAKQRVGVAMVAALFLSAGCGSTSEADEAATEATTESAGSPESTEDESTTTQPVDETETSAESGDTEELFPDVIDATASLDGDGTWTVRATLSSPYDSPERYADAWRVVGPDGTVYGTRVLTHDHADEQPFTRSESGIEIPDDVESVIVEGHDQISGWGGQTFSLELAR